MKKYLGVLVVLIIFFIGISVNYSYATEQIDLKVETDKAVAKPGDKIAVTISALNNYEDDIVSLAGVLSYKSDVFEIDVLDYDTIIEDVDSTSKTILEEMKNAMEAEGKECKIISIYEDWYIFLVEESGVTGFAAISALNPLKNSSTHTKIGEVNFTVKESARSATEKIALNNMTAASMTSQETESTEKYNVVNASTQEITINGVGNSGMEDIPSLDNDDEETENSDNKNQNDENSQVADSETPYTGAEDVIPYILILVIVGFVGYIKYNKYKGI